MPDQQGADPDTSNPEDMSVAMNRIAERSQRLISDFVAKQTAGGGMGMADPMNVGQAFLELTQRMMTNPAQFVFDFEVTESLYSKSAFCSYGIDTLIPTSTFNRKCLVNVITTLLYCSFTTQPYASVMARLKDSTGGEP